MQVILKPIKSKNWKEWKAENKKMLVYLEDFVYDTILEC